MKFSAQSFVVASFFMFYVNGKVVKQSIRNNINDHYKSDDKKNDKNNRHHSPAEFKVGLSLNILPNYGGLIQNFKVLPVYHFNNTVFKNQSFEIFQRNSYWANAANSGTPGGYADHFLIDFCDTPKDLYSAYFDHFQIEGISEPYKAFFAGISDRYKARVLGFDPIYVGRDDCSYVLVRLFRKDVKASLDGKPRLMSDFQHAFSKIRIGSKSSAQQFINEFGTHVIVEYELGEVIYQVYVFPKKTYASLKTNFALSYEKVKADNASTYDESPNNLLNIKVYFTPRFAQSIGEVMMATGSDVIDEMHGKMSTHYFRQRNFQSIFSLLDNDEETSKKLLSSKKQAIVGMTLKKITKALPPSSQRHWLAEILDNTLSLFYISY